MDRSSRPEVRNPLLKLSGIRAMQTLDDESRAAIRVMLSGLRKEARELAERSWVARKPPVASYWAAVSVWAYHASRLLRDDKARESQVERAYELADRHMMMIIESECAGDRLAENEWRPLGEDRESLRSFSRCQPNVKEACRWLVERGKAEVKKTPKGEVLVVLVKSVG